MKFFSQLFLVVCCVLLAAPASAAPIVTNSFSTTWNTGVTSSVVIDLGVCPSAVYWEEIGNATNNGTSTVCVGSNQTITFPSPGQYRVDFSGSFTTIDLDSSPNKAKFRTVEQWGNSVWTTLASAFQSVSELSIPASDAPDLSSVTSLESMFRGATNFNSAIEHWDVSNITDMSELFGWPGDSSAFNQPLNNWDVSNVTDMEWMFFGTPFNQPLNNWDVSHVISMNYMFNSMPNFNQPLNTWSVASVTTMVSMFGGTNDFNQPLDTWDTSNVTNMGDVFFQTQAFNQPLNSWDVSSVTNMNRMFGDARVFNQPLDTWDTSNVTNMGSMFESSAFDQTLANWDVSNVTDMEYMLNGSRMSPANYSDLLSSWSLQSLQSGLILGATGLVYYETATSSRQNLITTYSWTVQDAGLYVAPSSETFITVWDTRLDANTPNKINIFAGNTAAPFIIDWGDGTTQYRLTSPNGYISHSYTTPGVKIVSITGTFPYFYAGCWDGDEHNKLIDVAQWGTGLWSSFQESFGGCTHLAGFSATDVPNLSNVTDMSYAFNEATNFNHRLDTWDVSNVTTMENMLTDTALSEAKYTKLLNSWSALTLQPNVYFSTDAPYCGATAQTARDVLSGAPNNWIITDGGATTDCLIEVDETESSGGSSATRIGNRIKSYFYSSTTSSSPAMVTTESFLEGVRNLIEHLSKNEDTLKNLTPEESASIISGLWEIVRYLLTLLSEL